MNNLDCEADREATQLLEYQRLHKELDLYIKERYNAYAPDSEINRLKTKKLWYKYEIYRITNKLREYL